MMVYYMIKNIWSYSFIRVYHHTYITFDCYLFLKIAKKNFWIHWYGWYNISQQERRPFIKNKNIIWIRIHIVCSSRQSFFYKSWAITKRIFQIIFDTMCFKCVTKRSFYVVKCIQTTRIFQTSSWMWITCLVLLEHKSFISTTFIFSQSNHLFFRYILPSIIKHTLPRTHVNIQYCRN